MRSACVVPLLDALPCVCLALGRAQTRCRTHEVEASRCSAGSGPPAWHLAPRLPPTPSHARGEPLCTNGSGGVTRLRRASPLAPGVPTARRPAVGGEGDRVSVLRGEREAVGSPSREPAALPDPGGRQGGACGHESVWSSRVGTRGVRWAHRAAVSRSAHALSVTVCHSALLVAPSPGPGDCLPPGPQPARPQLLAR